MMKTRVVALLMAVAAALAMNTEAGVQGRDSTPPGGIHSTVAYVFPPWLAYKASVTGLATYRDVWPDGTVADGESSISWQA